MSTTSTTTRKIGNSDVSTIVYGARCCLPRKYTSRRGAGFNQIALDAVYASGCTHWDTADVYGDSEELIGKWLKRTGKRDQIFLATKFGFVLGGLVGSNGKRTICGDSEYASQALERSLKKLDYVDLWYLHRADQTVPIEVTLRSIAGKVRYIGLSEVSAATLRRAHAVHPITALQVEYSPFPLDIESEKHAVLKVARELGIKIVAYSPVGRGLLTGRFQSPDDLEPNDVRHVLPRFSRENFPNVLKIVDGIKAIADKHGATPGQVSLAWLSAQGDNILPIPGSTKPANIMENMAAQNVKLTLEEIAQIRKLAIDADGTIGERYPSECAALVLVDTPPLN